jgi:hypothetical protein
MEVTASWALDLAGKSVTQGGAAVVAVNGDMYTTLAARLQDLFLGQSRDCAYRHRGQFNSARLDATLFSASQGNDVVLVAKGR